MGLGLGGVKSVGERVGGAIVTNSSRRHGLQRACMQCMDMPSTGRMLCRDLGRCHTAAHNAVHAALCKHGCRASRQQSSSPCIQPVQSTHGSDAGIGSRALR